jgi:hypothetical protein
MQYNRSGFNVLWDTYLVNTVAAVSGVVVVDKEPDQAGYAVIRQELTLSGTTSAMQPVSMNAGGFPPNTYGFNNPQAIICNPTGASSGCVMFLRDGNYKVDISGYVNGFTNLAPYGPVQTPMDASGFAGAGASGINYAQGVVTAVGYMQWQLTTASSGNDLSGFVYNGAVGNEHTGLPYWGIYFNAINAWNSADISAGQYATSFILLAASGDILGCTGYSAQSKEYPSPGSYSGSVNMNCTQSIVITALPGN